MMPLVTMECLCSLQERSETFLLNGISQHKSDLWRHDWHFINATSLTTFSISLLHSLFLIFSALRRNERKLRPAWRNNLAHVFIAVKPIKFNACIFSWRSLFCSTVIVKFRVASCLIWSSVFSFLNALNNVTQCELTIAKRTTYYTLDYFLLRSH
jgi:hypothetical protein